MTKKVWSNNKVKLATLVEGHLKASVSIATTPRCRGGRYSIPWMALRGCDKKHNENKMKENFNNEK